MRNHLGLNDDDDKSDTRSNFVKPNIIIEEIIDTE